MPFVTYVTKSNYVVLGKPETKAIEVKGSEAKKAGAKNGAPAKQVKVVEPKKDEEEDSEDDSDDVSGSSDEEVFDEC